MVLSQLRKWSGWSEKATLAAEYELVRHCTDALSEFGLADVAEDEEPRDSDSSRVLT